MHGPPPTQPPPSPTAQVGADLVIGGAGFIGSNLVRALAGESDRPLLVADNLCATYSPWLIQDLIDSGRVRFFHADIRCPEDLVRLPAGPYRRVYHLAASFANELSVEHPLLDLRANAQGTAHVATFAKERGCGLLVYTGSSSSYGAAPRPMREDGPLLPQTAYATNKLEGERMVRQSGVPYAIFRLFNVYGPGDSPGRYRNAIPNMCKALEGEGQVTLLGEGATRDFSYVTDILPPFLQPERAEGLVLNVGTGVETPIATLIERLLKLYGLPQTRVRRAPRRAWDEVLRRQADVTALRRRFGDWPRTALDEGLQHTAAWLHRSGLVARPPLSLVKARSSATPPPGQQG